MLPLNATYSLLLQHKYGTPLSSSTTQARQSANVAWEVKYVIEALHNIQSTQCTRKTTEVKWHKTLSSLIPAWDKMFMLSQRSKKYLVKLLQWINTMHWGDGKWHKALVHIIMKQTEEMQKDCTVTKGWKNTENVRRVCACDTLQANASLCFFSSYTWQ